MNEGTVADRHVHPATIPLRFAKDLPQTLIGLPALFAFMSDTGWTYVIPIALAAAVVLILVQWLNWSRFTYGVGSHEIVIESGILSRNRRSIPFDRVQDVDIERGPLARLFGLAKVRIETGGSAKDEGVLDSVTVAEADRLRAAIRAGKAGHDVTAAAAGLPAEEVRPIFAMAPPRVFVSGLFNFSLVYLAGIFAILQTFEAWIPFDIHDPGRWIGLVDQSAVRGFTVGAALAVLMVALLLGVVTGVVRTLARDYGFRLLGEGARLRRERGLFTRSEVVLPRNRIQLALLRSGPMRRALGFAELFFQTLSAGAGAGGQQSVAPLAKPQEVASVLQEAKGLTLPAPGSLERVSSRHVVRAAIRDVLVPLALVLGVAPFKPEALLLLPLLPILLGAAFLRRRFHRFGVKGETLFVQSGIWRQRLWIVPVRNLQAMSLSRSFLQRRLGLASLSVDTAGAPIMAGPRIVDLNLGRAHELRDELAERLKRPPSARLIPREREAGAEQDEDAAGEAVEEPHRARPAQRRGDGPSGEDQGGEP
jgi:putative membrane protein